ncbi:N-acetyltransferase [Paenibacillus sp. y28]|uniref:N-acetyltransferase n=1 Tax=Paenibacillus sp. y28 TaxID=3129110 RepID=UPI003018D0CE
MAHIREAAASDMDLMIGIWLRGSIQAHSFIDREYWMSKADAMKNTYLPMAVTYVLDEGEGPVGFISMVDHYLAALFIDPVHCRKGYGRRLLDDVKRRKDRIELKVYRENEGALGFYLKNGFTIREELVDEQTSAAEYVMVWTRAQ